MRFLFQNPLSEYPARCKAKQSRDSALSAAVFVQLIRLRQETAPFPAKGTKRELPGNVRAVCVFLQLHCRFCLQNDYKKA